MKFKKWGAWVEKRPHRESEKMMYLDWKTEREKLIGALVGAAVPLEALLASVKWELAPAIVEEIAKAVREIRAVL